MINTNPHSEGAVLVQPLKLTLTKPAGVLPVIKTSEHLGKIFPECFQETVINESTFHLWKLADFSAKHKFDLYLRTPLAPYNSVSTLLGG